MDSTSIKQRKDIIMANAWQHGSVSVSRMAQQLGISDATIRRDLKSLSAEGLLQLTHGGAELRKDIDYSFISKSLRNVEEKTIIAELAAQTITDNQQLFLDSGTTCFHMAGHIRTKKDISVIVNSIRTAQELHGPQLNVLILGGTYRPDRLDSVGPMAVEALSKLRGYRAFIGCDGLDIDGGPGSVDLDSAHICAQAILNAQQVTLLADSSKFQSPGLFQITQWNNVSRVITGKMPEPTWQSFFQEKDIELIYPENL